MEWKIGEIFEHNGEWYQCVEGNCANCSIEDEACEQRIINDVCKLNRIFKKLEKVGEPYYSKYLGKSYQGYKTYIPAVGSNFKIRVTPVEYIGRNEIFIEIKQTNEDMEEKKLNLKPFSLEAAKAGKPVCTRDGRKARIICFDKKDSKPIVALIQPQIGNDIEVVMEYHKNGRVRFLDKEDENDLMMLPEKKEGWINVYRDYDGVNITKDDNIYSLKDAAIASAQMIDRDNYVATIKIQWEE